MDIDFNALPWIETPGRKAEALKTYRGFFGEDVPTSQNQDARYLAAVVSLISEAKATEADVADFEKFLKTLPARPHAD